MNLHIFTFNLFHEHTMVLESGDGGCVIVDPGFYEASERDRLYACLEERRLSPEAILVTHCHIDHIWGAKELQDRFRVPLYMGPEDVQQYEFYDKMASKLNLVAPDYGFKVTHVSDGETVRAAGFEFKVITTPGHSPGGVCYLEEKERLMFTGDTLFAGTIGRTDLFLGEYDDLIKSIMEKLMPLDGDIAIYPGHGPSSSIAEERTGNPFLEPFNEPDEATEPSRNGK